jgi:hypothetical protein
LFQNETALVTSVIKVIKRKIRKGVETAFSIITSKFGKYIHATSISGFLTKLKLFLLSYSLDCLYKANYDTI